VESLAGTTIGGYKLIESIKFGPTGETLAAEDNSGAPCTVKVLHQSLSLYSKVESYWEEIQEVGNLSSPYIAVPIEGDWSKAGRFYMAMPSLDGPNLRQVLDQHKKIPAQQILLLMGQLCQALDAAHREGLVHGALKPDNIHLIFKENPEKFSVRLLNFSTGCLLNGPATLEGEEDVVGVSDPRYLAPEQFAGDTVKSSDIYALGILLCELLSGRTPFSGSFAEIIDQHNAKVELPSSIPEKLNRIIRKCLAFDPQDRFAEASELREILDIWASTKPAELEQPLIDLGPKKEDAPVVHQEEDAGQEPVDEQADAPEQETASEAPVEEEAQEPDVQQPAEEMDQVPAEESEFDKKATQETPPVGSDPAPEEEELAAIAEQASSQLRQEKAPPQQKESKKDKERKKAKKGAGAAPEALAGQAPETYRDGDSQLVELPVEKSVKAFVDTISPHLAAAAPTTFKSGNGESIDSALDDFINKAMTENAALPSIAVDEKSLADLAVPLKKPEPEPEPEPEPQVAAPVAVAQPEPVQQKNVLGYAVIAFVLGGLLVFGGLKLLTPDSPPAAPSDIQAAPSAAAEPPAGSPQPAAEPAPAGSPQPAAEPAPTASTEPPPEPAPSPGTPGPETTPLDEPYPAASTEPAGSEPPPAAASSEPPGDPPSEPPPGVDEPKPAEPPPAVAVAKKRAKPKAKSKPRKKKAAVAKKRKKPVAAARVRKPKPAKKKKKKRASGGDWVDPFSQ